MSIPSKTGNLDANGALKVSLAANTGVASKVVDTAGPPPAKLPSTPLANRRTFVVTIPLDAVYMGDSTILDATGYPSRGVTRGTSWTHGSARSVYSNRKQFLRGQYLTLRITDDIDFYVIKQQAVEQAVGFELS